MLLSFREDLEATQTLHWVRLLHLLGASFEPDTTKQLLMLLRHLSWGLVGEWGQFRTLDVTGSFSSTYIEKCEHKAERMEMLEKLIILPGKSRTKMESQDVLRD